VEGNEHQLPVRSITAVVLLLSFFIDVGKKTAVDVKVPPGEVALGFVGPLSVPSDRFVPERTPWPVTGAGDSYFLGLRLKELVSHLCGLSVAAVALGVFAGLGVDGEGDTRVE
jgi:hypothetical protein